MTRLAVAALLALPLAAGAQALQLKPGELKVVEQGFHDAAAGSKAKTEPAERQEAITKLVQARTNAAAEKEKASSKDFLAKAAQEKGAQKTPSGLVIKVLRPGKGPSPKETDKVKVNYEGRLINGTVFDSSYKRGQPAEFPLNGVIKCWTEGVQKLHVGEEAELVCPSDIAYGDHGHPPTIPDGAAGARRGGVRRIRVPRREQSEDGFAQAAGAGDLDAGVRGPRPGRQEVGTVRSRPEGQRDPHQQRPVRADHHACRHPQVRLQRPHHGNCGGEQGGGARQHRVFRHVHSERRRQDARPARRGRHLPELDWNGSEADD